MSKSNEILKKKLCLLGDFAVGKTSLIRRFVCGIFEEKYVATIGTVITKKVLSPMDGYQVELMIWDIMGSHDFDRIPDNYIRGSDGAIIVSDLTRPETIAHIPLWIDHLRSLSPNVPMVLLGNKTDLMDETLLEKTSSRLSALSDRYDSRHFLTSAKTGDHVDTVFTYLGERLIVATLEHDDAIGV